MKTKPQLVYVTYIKTTPKKLWAALTKPEFTRKYWGGMANVSDWKESSTWQHVTKGKTPEVYIQGKVEECVQYKRLVLTWADPDDLKDVSRVTFEIIPFNKDVRLNVIHGDFKPGSVMSGKVSSGWPVVIASLKSFLETGKGIDFSCQDAKEQ